MKRQFIHPQIGKGYQPGQTPDDGQAQGGREGLKRAPLRSAEGPYISTIPAQQMSPVGSVTTPDQPQRGSPPPTFIPHRPITNGLISNWNPNEPASLPFVWNPAPVSLADQETIEQEVIQGPNGNGYGQGFSQGQVSPHQSAITPPGAVYPGAQPLNPSQSAISMRGPISDALLPMNGYNSQTLPPPQRSEAERVSMLPLWSGQFSPSLPPMHSQGQAGGPPPFIQPPSGEGWNRKPKKKRRVPIWAKIVLFSLLFLVVGAGSYIGYYWIHDVNNIVGQYVPPLPGDKSNETANTTRNGGDILSGGRINILLLGSDTDQKFNGNYIAQTDIVITIDPATKNVGMLSIPRDFYINVPGYGMHKLDEAYGLGGVALSRLTIYQDFGIPINYYAWVGLNGFVKVIDTVGGVDVDVMHPITDDNYPDDVGNPNTGDIYALKRLYIAPGPQHLSGQAALEYVRSRHADLIGDFGRSARQQEVLSQLKNKLNNPGIIGKLPAIADDLNGYVKTDMQLGDVYKLLNFARGLDQNKINRVILDPPYSAIGDVGTESVVFPNCAKIVPEIAQMFALSNNARCNIQANTGTSSAGASLAIASPSPSANAAVQTLPGNVGAQVANTSVTGLVGNVGDLFGMRSLLDLLFATVFESPSALQV